MPSPGIRVTGRGAPSPGRGMYVTDLVFGSGLGRKGPGVERWVRFLRIGRVRRAIRLGLGFWVFWREGGVVGFGEGRVLAEELKLSWWLTDGGNRKMLVN